MRKESKKQENPGWKAGFFYGRCRIQAKGISGGASRDFVDLYG
jgi:hypothetical protein